MQLIANGPVGIVDGTLMWFGGILIFAVIAIFTVPLGLGLRFLIETIPLQPLGLALVTGTVVSIAIMLILHPAMMPGISLSTKPYALVVLHLAAGLAGGLIWWIVENPSSSEERQA